MTDWLAILAGGFLGSAHCVGMCGGFAAVVGSTGQSMGRSVGRQVVYSLGRVFTYAFLGAMGGYAGSYLSRFDGALVSAQQVFSVAAGVIMILIGIGVLGLGRFRWSWLTRVGTAVAPVFRHFLTDARRGSVFVAGVANGFLPCGLVYAFLALAVASGQVGTGLAIMVLFGVGTIPAMTLVGCGSTLLSHHARLRIYRLAACFVILAGAMSIKRGWPGDSECCSVEETGSQFASPGSHEIHRVGDPVRAG